MSGAKHRRRGDDVERELVHKHRDIGVFAERYPRSGASRFRGGSHDLDIYVRGPEAAPWIAEVKSRKGGAGFTVIEKWLADYDALFLRRHRADPLVVVPWRIWAELIKRVPK